MILQIEKNKQKFVKSYSMLQEAFAKASAKYQKQYAVYAATNKKDDEMPNPPPKPVDYSKQYDFYIDMLLKHDADIISLSETVYRKLWMNQFDWRWNYVQNLRYYVKAGGSGSSTSAFALMADEFESEPSENL